MNRKNIICCAIGCALSAGLAVAQVTIGSLDMPDPSAILDMKAVNNRGALLPHVTLTGSEDVTTIENPVIGLLAYNTGNHPDFPLRAFVYWDGAEWRALSAMTTSAADASLQCGMTYLDPEIVIVGDDSTPIPPGQIMKLPYTIGNGGIHSGVVLHSFPVGNVTATLYPGQLENGSGYLTFHLAGTPNTEQKTPKGIKFALDDFYDANPNFTRTCDTVRVGVEVRADLKTVAVMDNMKWTDDNGVVGYATQITTPDEKFSVRAFIVSSDFSTYASYFGYDGIYGMNLQLRNNTESTLDISGQWNWHWGGSGGSYANNLRIRPGVWSGTGGGDLAGVGATIYYATEVDGASDTPVTASILTTDFTKAKFTAWGNNGVYAAGGPERRVYSWTENSLTTKTSYILTFSSNAVDPSIVPKADTCEGGICPVQCFMLIEQIIAP